MRTHQVVALSLLLAAGSAGAQQTLGSVKVQAETREIVSVACGNPAASLPPKEVERVLGITDSRQTGALRTKLISASGEACRAGIAMIAVQRGANGQSLTWTAM